MAVYFAMPLIWMLISMTKGQYGMLSTPMFEFPKHWSLLANMKLISSVGHGIYWRWYLNSVLYSLVVALLATLLSSMIGYAVSKFRFSGNQVIQWVILASLMIPGAASVIPIFILEKSMNLIDTYVGVILPQIVNPFGAYFMITYIREAMPAELIEAARVDGASEVRIFFSIAVSVIRPGLITLFLIAFVGSWNNFFLPLLLLTNQKLFPLTLGLNDWLSTSQSQGVHLPIYPLMVTGSVISILPLLILFPFLQRYIAAGLTQGGIKI